MNVKTSKIGIFWANPVEEQSKLDAQMWENRCYYELSFSHMYKTVLRVTDYVEIALKR